MCQNLIYDGYKLKPDVDIWGVYVNHIFADRKKHSIPNLYYKMSTIRVYKLEPLGFIFTLAVYRCKKVLYIRFHQDLFINVNYIENLSLYKAIYKFEPIFSKTVNPEISVFCQKSISI